LCARYGVSRPTGYTWVDRYVSAGPTALVDRSAAPRMHPNATPAAVAELLLETRQAHPTWGPRKLIASVARRYPGLKLPAVSTVAELLRRTGLSAPRKRYVRANARPPSHLGSQIKPNDTWAMDFKGQFRLRDGQYCYPFTLEDGASRFLLRIQGLHRPTGENVWLNLQSAFREYGVPVAIRSDNGPPFAAPGFTGLTGLAVRCLQQGIRLDRTRPGSPQDNGRLERMHRTLAEEACSPPQKDLRAQQGVFLGWRREYNEERPHEALEMRVPADDYSPSEKSFQERISPPSYEGMHVRRVPGGGQISFGGWLINLTSALKGEQVGVRETDDGVCEMVYYSHLLCKLDLRSGVVDNGRHTRRCERHPNSQRPHEKS
jgi:putative transposase